MAGGAAVGAAQGGDFPPLLAAICLEVNEASQWQPHCAISLCCALTRAAIRGKVPLPGSAGESEGSLGLTSERYQGRRAGPQRFGSLCILIY